MTLETLFDKKTNKLDSFSGMGLPTPFWLVMILGKICYLVG